MAPHLKVPPDRGLPLATWIDLVTHPERNVSGYLPFEDARDDRYRFRPAADGWSRINAWWLAEASFLSYWHDDAEATDIYSRQTGLAYVPLSEGATQCSLAVDPNFAIVAFRGTQPDQWQDILDDARFTMGPWKQGHAHEGFVAAFQRIAPRLLDAVKQHAPNRPLWVTGHSLGAALATLAAEALPNVGGVCTFGSPLVGDQVFAGFFNQQGRNRSFRYVNDHDIVTHLPPGPFGLPTGVYTHVDEERAINADGQIGSAPPTPQHFVRDVFGRPVVAFHILQALMSHGFPSMPDALADHAPVLYVTQVWNDLFLHGD